MACHEQKHNPWQKKRTPKGSGDVVDIGNLAHVLHKFLKGGGGQEADQLLEGQLMIASVADGQDLGANFGWGHGLDEVVEVSPRCS